MPDIYSFIHIACIVTQDGSLKMILIGGVGPKHHHPHRPLLSRGIIYNPQKLKGFHRTSTREQNNGSHKHTALVYKAPTHFLWDSHILRHFEFMHPLPHKYLCLQAVHISSINFWYLHLVSIDIVLVYPPDFSYWYITTFMISLKKNPNKDLSLFISCQILIQTF